MVCRCSNDLQVAIFGVRSVTFIPAADAVA
jgi:hypothetical protein